MSKNLKICGLVLKTKWVISSIINNQNNTSGNLVKERKNSIFYIFDSTITELDKILNQDWKKLISSTGNLLNSKLLKKISLEFKKRQSERNCFKIDSILDGVDSDELTRKF